MAIRSYCDSADSYFEFQLTWLLNCKYVYINAVFLREQRTEQEKKNKMLSLKDVAIIDLSHVARNIILINQAFWTNVQEMNEHELKMKFFRPSKSENDDCMVLLIVCNV